MNLASLNYLLFLALVVLFYYIVPRKIQPWVLFLFSLYFYAAFGTQHFLFLGFSILVTWLTGILVQNTPSVFSKKLFLCAGITLNLLPLFFLKQFNTFSGLLSKALGLAGICFTPPVVTVLAPIGISFYTLTAIAYCVDAYRGKFPAQKNPLKFALYISFFPTILQGPILRYDDVKDGLFPEQKKRFDLTQCAYGAQLLLWGLFKKMVIADRVAIIANEIFENYTSYHGFTLIVGALAYSLQIYTDFSGCVDIVRGSSQILGISLPENFRQPYFATSIADFWHRWHISLSSWFRDYVYIPLGGNRKGKLRQYLNIIIVFLISGIWHGAGTNFMIWGLLHGIYQVLGKLLKTPREWIARWFGMGQHLPKEQFALRHKSRKFLQILITFALVTFSWIFFRLPHWQDGFDYIRLLFTLDNIGILFDKSLYALGLGEPDLHALLIFVGVLLIASLLQRKYRMREKIAQLPLIFRWSVYIIGILIVVLFGMYGRGYTATDFIYGGF